MDDRPDILSSGPRGGPRRPPWPPGPAAAVSPVIKVAAGAVLACLAAIFYLVLLVGHRDATIAGLRAELRETRQPVTTAAPALPLYASSAMLTFPDKSGGSFLMVAAAIRPQPGSGPVTWLFVYGQHLKPGARYGLLGGSCADGNLVSYDWAAGTADWKGDLTIAAPDLFINAQDPDIWLLVHRQSDNSSLGGVRGPLIGGGAKAFRSAPSC